MFFIFFYNFNFSSRGKLPLFKDTGEFILGTEHQRECNLKVGLVLIKMDMYSMWETVLKSYALIT